MIVVMVDDNDGVCGACCLSPQDHYFATYIDVDSYPLPTPSPSMLTLTPLFLVGGGEGRVCGVCVWCDVVVCRQGLVGPAHGVLTLSLWGSLWCDAPCGSVWVPKCVYLLSSSALTHPALHIGVHHWVRVGARGGEHRHTQRRQRTHKHSCMPTCPRTHCRPCLLAPSRDAPTPS